MSNAQLIMKSKCFNENYRLCIACCALCIVLLGSCGYFKKNSVSDDVLARVGNKVLLRSDVEGVLSEFSGMSDSAEMAKSVINSWAKKQVLIAEADKYLAEQKIDFTPQLEDYKNSLLIYAYENDRAQKELDTVVSNEDIAKYYETNKEQFKASEILFKGIYFKVDNDSLKDIKKRVSTLISNRDVINIDRAELFCTNSTIDYIITTNKYTPLQTIIDKIPVYTLDVKELCNKQDLSEFKGENHTHYISVFDYIERGQIMPLEMAARNVKSMILKQRRFEFLDRINKQLYEEALKNEDIEIY